jgi:hypothetical protein
MRKIGKLCRLKGQLINSSAAAAECVCDTRPMELYGRSIWRTMFPNCWVGMFA